MVAKCQLLGYAIINGNIAFNHNFFKEVNSQDEIEVHRKLLEEKYKKSTEKFSFNEEEHDFKISFIIRQLPDTGLKG